MDFLRSGVLIVRSFFGLPIMFLGLGLTLLGLLIAGEPAQEGFIQAMTRKKD